MSLVIFLSNRYAVTEAVTLRERGSGMEQDTSRILIETMVRKTLREIEHFPERSIRNLVDMALHFSKGRFQQNFFSMAQTMLKNERSAYYKLIQDIVTHVEQDHLVTFGMNLGYNSCTAGAKTIRQIEAVQGFNVPWSIALEIEPAVFRTQLGRYHALIAQGEQLGIYTWMLFAQDIPRELLFLIESHSDSSFILFCDPLDLSTPVLEYAAELHNLMLAVRYDTGVAEACTLLRATRLLYAVYYPYSAADEPLLTSGELFRTVEPMHPAFTALLPAMDCPITTCHTVYQAVKRAREQQIYQTIPFELFLDCSRIDGIVSDDACAVGFDRAGTLYTHHTRRAEPHFNLLQSDLRTILQKAFPKKEMSRNEDCDH